MEKKPVILETKRMTIRDAAESEIPWIIDLESHPDNRDYLWIGTSEEHKAEISDPCHLLLIFDDIKNGSTSDTLS